MSKNVERFEDLIAWQKAKKLARDIYKLATNQPFVKGFGLTIQMQRAAVSIMSNIAEGFDRSSRTEFHRFIVIAKSSCAELRSQLHLAFDTGYANQARFDKLIHQAEEVSRILGGLKASLAKQL